MLEAYKFLMKMQLHRFWWLIDENMNYNIDIQELIVFWRETVKKIKKYSNSDDKQSVNMEVVKNKI